MKPEMPELCRLVIRLNKFIGEVAAANFDETAALLRMAQIDLLTRVYSISQEELDTLLFMAQSEQKLADIPRRTAALH